MMPHMLHLYQTPHYQLFIFVIIAIRKAVEIVVSLKNTSASFIIVEK